MRPRAMRIAAPLSAVGSFGLVLGVAAALYALAARHYVAASRSLATGAAASAVNGWNLVAPGQAPPSVAAFDLAAQANTSRAELIAVATANSVVLLGIAAVIALGIGIPLGFWLGVSGPRWVVGAARSLTGIGITFPAFFLVFLLQLVAIRLAEIAGHTVLPVYGYGLDQHVVLPAVALAIPSLAYATRLVALAAEDVERRDYVRTARAKGLTERIVVYRHIAANMVGTIGESALGAVRLALAGLVIVEYLLVWPGLGVLILRATNVQDVPVMLGGIAVLGLAFLAVEIALDLVTARTRLRS